MATISQIYSMLTQNNRETIYLEACSHSYIIPRAILSIEIIGKSRWWLSCEAIRWAICVQRIIFIRRSSSTKGNNQRNRESHAAYAAHNALNIHTIGYCCNVAMNWKKSFVYFYCLLFFLLLWNIHRWTT